MRSLQQLLPVNGSSTYVGRIWTLPDCNKPGKFWISDHNCGRIFGFLMQRDIRRASLDEVRTLSPQWPEDIGDNAMPVHMSGSGSDSRDHIPSIATCCPCRACKLLPVISCHGFAKGLAHLVAFVSRKHRSNNMGVLFASAGGRLSLA